MKVIYFAIIALMTILAIYCYDWGGIFIAEGVLAGLCFFVAGEIEKKGKNKKDDA